MEVTLAQFYAQQSEIRAILMEIYKLNAILAVFCLIFVLALTCFGFWKFLRIFI